MGINFTPVSIDSRPDPIPVDTGVSVSLPPPMRPEVINDMADRASFGLDKPFQDVRNTIATGQEDALRNKVAADTDVEKQRQINQAIIATAQKKGAPLTTDEMNQVANLLKAKDAFTNPKSIFEEKMSKKYMEGMYLPPEGKQDMTATSGHWWETAQQMFPEATKAVVDAGEGFLFKDEVIRNRLQKTMAKVEDQSYPSYFADRLKNFLSMGVYSDIKLKSQMDGTTSWLLGSNLEEQRVNLYRLPGAEFVNKFSAIMDRLEADNPALAAEWASSMLGMAKSQIMGMNFESIGTYAMLPGTGTIAKAALGLNVKTAVSDLVRSAGSSFVDHGLPSGMPLDLFTHSNIAPPMLVRRAEGLGDLGESAVNVAAGRIVDGFKGTSNPAREVVSAMPRILRNQEEDVGKNIGNASRELVNRIQEAYRNTTTNVLDTLQNMIRGERIPAATATVEGMRVIKDAIKNNFPGPDSHIIEILDPIKEITSNTWWAPVKLGRTDATLFESREEARATMFNLGYTTIGKQLKLIPEEAAIVEPYANFTAYRNAQRAAGIKPADMRFKNSVEFSSFKNAKSYPITIVPEAKTGYSIEQEGKNFYVLMHRPVPEGDPLVQAVLIKTPESMSPDSYLSNALNWLRTPDETFSADARQNAKIAVIGPNNLMKLMKEELTEISKLAKWTFPGTSRKERWLDWERTIKAGQTMPDPYNPGKYGYMFRTIGELEDHYLQHFNRRPLDQEVEAYFAFKRWTEIDTILRELQEFKNRAISGVENHTIKSGKTSIEVPGMRLKELPGGTDNVLVMGTKPGEEGVLQLGDLKNLKEFKRIKDEILRGEGRIIELYEPQKYPLADFSPKIQPNTTIRYVYAKDIQAKPLTFDSIPRVGSRYWDYDYPFYIKQAKVHLDPISGFNWYRGDTTVMALLRNAAGKPVVEKLNQIREFIRDGKEAEAAALGRTLPMPWTTVRGWFNEARSATGGVIPPMLSLHEPIQIVPRGRLVGQMSDALERRYAPGTFKDGTRSGSESIKRQTQFTGEPDAYEIYALKDTGTLQKPLYNYQPADKIDPIPMMNRAMSRISKSLYMDDYRQYTINHWIQEAKQWLNANPSSLEESPAWHFYNTDFRPGTPDNVRRLLEDNRQKAKMIFGQTSELDRWLYTVASKLSDSIYEGKGLGKVTSIDPSWMIPKLADAGRVLRSLTFDAVLGLFSPAQLLVQNMTWVTIAGIEGPLAASKAVPAALFHVYANKNINALSKLDEYMTNFGWKAGEFKEAYELFHRTGFGTVGVEHVLTPDALSAKVVSNGYHNFLDLGRTFFKWGERSSRYGGWYTAFKKYRDLNPTGRITDYELGKIFENAEMLSGNMTAASKSYVQRGLWSFPTQFLSYNLRLMELMTGKRLTPAQRWRVIGTYASMFGIPSAAGLTGFPVGDFMRQAAIDNHYVPSTDTAIDSSISALMEGFPAFLMKLGTGHWYNFGQRYGSPSFDILRELMIGDKTVWSIFGGASANTVLNGWESSNGFRQAMMSVIRDEDKHFPLTWDNVADLLKTTTIGNNISRTWQAINTGIWYSRKGTPLATDVSPMNALWMGASGLQPVSVGDITNKTAILHSRKDNENKGSNEFKLYYERFLRDLKNNDPEAARNHMSQARAILKIYGIPSEKYGQVLNAAMRGNETLISRINWDLYMKDVPSEQKSALRETYRKSLAPGAQ